MYTEYIHIGIFSSTASLSHHVFSSNIFYGLYVNAMWFWKTLAGTAARPISRDLDKVSAERSEQPSSTLMSGLVPVSSYLYWHVYEGMWGPAMWLQGLFVPQLALIGESIRREWTPCRGHWNQHWAPTRSPSLTHVSNNRLSLFMGEPPFIYCEL